MFCWLSVCALAIGSLALVASDSLESKYCCAPTKFESLLTFMGAKADGAKPAPVLMNQRLSYDYDDRQMAITMFEQSKEVAKYIYKYNQNKYYKITPDKNCSHFAINSTLIPPCIPDDAVMLGSIYLGAEDEKFNVNAYYVQQSELNIYGTFTPKHCYPATEGYIGESDADPVVMTIVYSDTKPGIADPAVFKVPKQCTQGEEDEVHATTKHVLNKFTRK